MKKLSEEQINKIATDVYNEIIPNQNDDKELSSLMLNMILTTITKFAIKYQEEVEE